MGCVKNEKGEYICERNTPCYFRIGRPCEDLCGTKVCLSGHAQGKADNEATIAEQAAEIGRLRNATLRFAGAVLNVRGCNTDEWMRFLANEVNKLAAEVGETQRWRFAGDGLALMEKEDKA